MHKDQKIKFAVVGAGHIGKRHAEMISRDPEGELVAMVDVRSAEECDATHFNVPFF
jgi:predicted dehydrogenase